MESRLLGYDSSRGTTKGCGNQRGRQNRTHDPEIEDLPNDHPEAVPYASKERRTSTARGAPGPPIRQGVNKLDSTKSMNKQRMKIFGGSIEGRAAANAVDEAEKKEKRQSWKPSLPPAQNDQGSPDKHLNFLGQQSTPRSVNHLNSLVRSSSRSVGSPSRMALGSDNDPQHKKPPLSPTRPRRSSRRDTAAGPSSDHRYPSVIEFQDDSDVENDDENDPSPNSRSKRKGRQQPPSELSEIQEKRITRPSDSPTKHTPTFTRANRSPARIEKSTAPHQSTSDEEEEQVEINEADEIGQFESQGKSFPPPPSVTHPIYPKKRPRMQDREGNVPQALPPPKVKTSSKLIEPSFKSETASVAFAGIIDQCTLAVQTVSVSHDKITLFRNASTGSAFFPMGLESLESMTVCQDADQPGIHFTVMRPTGVLLSRDLESLCIGGPLNSNKLTMLILLRKDEKSSTRTVDKILNECRGKGMQVTTTSSTTFKSLIDWMKSEKNNLPERGQRRRHSVHSSHDKDPMIDGETIAQESEHKSKGKGRAKEDPNQTKLSFSYTLPRRSHRLTNEHPIAIDHDDVEKSGSFTESNLPPRPKSPRLDKNEILFEYPLQGVSLLDIRRGHRYRLQDHEFLDDVFVEFGLREMMGLVQNQSSVHLFNSFFYDKISQRDRKSKAANGQWPAYDSVKKWTKKTDVFEKEFIIVPINESLHWYLAVIYQPGRMLRRLRKAGEKDATASNGSPAPTSTCTSPAPGTPEPVAATSIKDDIAGLESDTDLEPPWEDPDKFFDLSTASVDPLNIIDESNDNDMISADGNLSVAGGIRRISLQPESEPEPAGASQPIQSATLDLYNSQNKSDVEPKVQTTPVESRAVQKTREDVDIMTSEDAWILTFDSLGGSHKPVANTLNMWLKFEAWDKGKVAQDLEPIEARYLEARVPQQPNSSDCGVFMIHYVKRLFEDPKNTLQFIGVGPPLSKDVPARDLWHKKMQQVWKGEETINLRSDWIDKIDKFTAQWRSMHDSVVGGPIAGVVGGNDDENDEPVEANREGGGWDQGMIEGQEVESNVSQSSILSSSRPDHSDLIGDHRGTAEAKIGVVPRLLPALSSSSSFTSISQESKRSQSPQNAQSHPSKLETTHRHHTHDHMNTDELTTEPSKTVQGIDVLSDDSDSDAEDHARSINVDPVMPKFAVNADASSKNSILHHGYEIKGLNNEAKLSENKQMNSTMLHLEHEKELHHVSSGWSSQRGVERYDFYTHNVHVLEETKDELCHQAGERREQETGWVAELDEEGNTEGDDINEAEEDMTTMMSPSKVDMPGMDELDELAEESQWESDHSSNLRHPIQQNEVHEEVENNSLDRHRQADEDHESNGECPEDSNSSSRASCQVPLQDFKESGPDHDLDHYRNVDGSFPVPMERNSPEFGASQAQATIRDHDTFRAQASSVFTSSHGEIGSNRRSDPMTVVRRLSMPVSKETSTTTLKSKAITNKGKDVNGSQHVSPCFPSGSSNPIPTSSLALLPSTSKSTSSPGSSQPSKTLQVQRKLTGMIPRFDSPSSKGGRSERSESEGSSFQASAVKGLGEGLGTGPASSSISSSLSLGSGSVRGGGLDLTTDSKSNSSNSVKTTFVHGRSGKGSNKRTVSESETSGMVMREGRHQKKARWSEGGSENEPIEIDD